MSTLRGGFSKRAFRLRIYDPTVDPVALVGRNLGFVATALPNLQALLIDEEEFGDEPLRPCHRLQWSGVQAGPPRRRPYRYQHPRLIRIVTDAMNSNVDDTPLAGRTILVIVENLPVPFDRRVWQEACALRDAGAGVIVISPATRDYPDVGGSISMGSIFFVIRCRRRAIPS